MNKTGFWSAAGACRRLVLSPRMGAFVRSPGRKPWEAARAKTTALFLAPPKRKNQMTQALRMAAQGVGRTMIPLGVVIIRCEQGTRLNRSEHTQTETTRSRRG